MNKSEVIDQIKMLIADELDANLAVTEIGDNDSLFEDGLGLDSVAIVEFITILEERFGVQFSDTDLTSDTAIEQGNALLGEIMETKYRSRALADRAANETGVPASSPNHWSARPSRTASAMRP